MFETNTFFICKISMVNYLLVISNISDFSITNADFFKEEQILLLKSIDFKLFPDIVNDEGN